MNLAMHFRAAGERPIRYAALDNMMRRHLALLLRGNSMPNALEGVPDHFNATLGRLFNPKARSDELDLAALADRLVDTGHPMGGLLHAIHAQLTDPAAANVHRGLGSYPMYTPTWHNFPMTSRFPGFQGALTHAATAEPQHVNALASLSNIPHDPSGTTSPSALHSALLGFLRQHNPLSILGVHDAAHSALATHNQYALPGLTSARHLIGNTVIPHLAAVGRGEVQP